MNKIELAHVNDVDRCLEIIDSGKKFQNDQGFVEWTDDYPNRESILEDILANKGFVLRIDGIIAGYLRIDFTGMPYYKEILGDWHTEEPYATIHSFAIAEEYRNQGLASIALELVERLTYACQIYGVRLDTALENERMKHILKKNNYQICGKVNFKGADRVAFDKVLKERF